MPLLFTLSTAAVLMAAGAISWALLRPKKETPRKREQTVVIKLVELQEVPTAGNETENKTENATENRTQNATSIQKQPQEPLYITRVLAKSFKSRREAMRLLKRIKRVAPFLDPWILKEGRTFTVVAGSYRDEENIRLAKKVLERLGIKPRLQKIELRNIKKP